ncbi:PspC domain-containing protein [Nonomuraea sp. NPDC050540]|uniref:PspC domain-containing protein n=1 Tax=Nonomuraea sp. NPDC050540 TaxID=3364367 RepID=UPI003798615A
MTEAPSNEARVLRRSGEGRILTGVCAGLGRHTGIDPVVFRVGFAILLFGSGVGFFLYIAAFMLMKDTRGLPGMIEHWTRRDFDGEAVLAMMTAVLAFGLGINLTTVWLATGTLVVGLVLVISLLTAHANGVDLLALARSMPERLSRRQTASPQPTPPVPPPYSRPEPGRSMVNVAFAAEAAAPPYTPQRPYTPQKPYTPDNAEGSPEAADGTPTREQPATGQEPMAGEGPVTSHEPVTRQEPPTREEPVSPDEPTTHHESVEEPPTREEPIRYGEPLPEEPREHRPPRVHAAQDRPRTREEAMMRVEAMMREKRAARMAGGERVSPLPAEGVPSIPHREPFAPHGPYQPLDPAKRAGYSPYDPALYGRPVPPPTKKKRPRSFIGVITVLLALIIGGILVAVQSGSAQGVNPTTVGAAVLITIGAGLLVAAWWGRGAGLVALGTLVAVVIASGLIVGGLPKRVGDYDWTPLTMAEASRNYDVGVGEGRLDLSELKLDPGATAEFNASVSVGELMVIVPPSARVEVHATAKVGDITIDQSLRGGVDVEFDKILAPETPPKGAVSTIVLNLRGGMGDVEVRRAA